MKRLRATLGFHGLFTVDPVSKSDGLTLLWKEECDLVVHNFSRQHINARVLSLGGGFELKLTCFYRHPEIAKRYEAWDLLKHLKNMSPSP